MIDTKGEEWVTIAQALDRMPRMTPGRIKTWRHRGRIRAHVINRTLWISWQDILTQEEKTRRYTKRSRHGDDNV